uniref:Urokinase plasminogen activator surface receptor n=1 Tax=Monodelphis domestica TaxID=13616 RepID=A0A5F8H8H4_MONDO
RSLQPDLPLCFLLTPPHRHHPLVSPVSSALRCHHCESSGNCTVETCPPGQELCRTTVFYNRWKGGEELEVVVRGCAVTGKDNSSMSYRTTQEIIMLKETVCDFDLCNHPDPRPSPTFPGSRTLECESCASSDLSCERGRILTLRCPDPTDQCLERVIQSSPEGESMSPSDERYVRGCGSFPDCPGPVGFHNNDTFLFLRCCNHSQCISGPSERREKGGMEEGGKKEGREEEREGEGKKGERRKPLSHPFSPPAREQSNSAPSPWKLHLLNAAQRVSFFHSPFVPRIHMDLAGHPKPHFLFCLLFLDKF